MNLNTQSNYKAALGVLSFRKIGIVKDPTMVISVINVIPLSSWSPGTLILQNGVWIPLYPLSYNSSTLPCVFCLSLKTLFKAVMWLVQMQKHIMTMWFIVYMTSI